MDHEENLRSKLLVSQGKLLQASLHLVQLSDEILIVPVPTHRKISFAYLTMYPHSHTLLIKEPWLGLVRSGGAFEV